MKKKQVCFCNNLQADDGIKPDIYTWTMDNLCVRNILWKD